MPDYIFVCDTCETQFTVRRRMSEAGDPYDCPKCEGPARRVFYPTISVWHCEGSHQGDYGRGNHVGTKNDALRKTFKEAYGEDLPPPAPDVPRNGGEKY